MGNSIARGYLFNILEYLGGAYVTLENQKKMCPKNDVKWDSSCIQEIQGVNLKFLFFRYMDGFFYKDRGGFPWIKGKWDNLYNNNSNNRNYSSADKPPVDPIGDPDQVPDKDGVNIFHPKDDNCINMNTVECLKHFWRDAKEGDILLFQLGLAYCERENFDNIDYSAWLRASASAIRSNIIRYFPGNVFQVNLAPDNKFTRFHNVYECIVQVNTILFELWHPSSFDEKRWHHIDQFSINQNRFEYYNDWLHFNGPLSSATVQLMLNTMCPLEGKTIHLAKDTKLSGNLVLVKSTSPTTHEPIRAYYVDKYGYFQKIRNATGACITNIIYNGRISMSETEFIENNFHNLLTADFPTFCEMNQLITVPPSRSIYVALENGLSQFYSMGAMTSRGYDIDQGVAQLTLTDSQLFKEGELLK